MEAFELFIIIMLTACGLVIWLLQVIRNKFDNTPDFLRVEEDEEDYNFDKNYEPLLYDTQDKEIDDLYDVVNEYILKGNRAEANKNLLFFEKIIKKYPNRSYAYTKYAVASTLETEEESENNAINPNQDKIFKLIHKAVEIDPNESDVYSAWSYILAIFAFKQDTEIKTKEFLLDAITKIEKAIELKPDNDFLYEKYADILKILFEITQDKSIITKCDDLHKKAIQINPSSLNYLYWANTTAKFAKSFKNSDLYLDAIDLYHIALKKKEEEISESLSKLSNIPNSYDRPDLSLELKELYEFTYTNDLYENNKILMHTIKALCEYGYITNDINSLEEAFELCNTLSECFSKFEPDGDQSYIEYKKISIELQIANRKGQIKSEAPKLEAKLMEIADKKGKDFIAKEMMTLKSLTGNIKESYKWFVTLTEDHENLNPKNLNWEYIEEDENLANLVASEEYKLYKKGAIGEEIEIEKEVILQTNPEEENLQTNPEKENLQTNPEEENFTNSDLTILIENADKLSKDAKINKDANLHKEAIEAYRSAKEVADSVNSTQFSSLCELQIADNLISLSKINNELIANAAGIEDKLIKTLKFHFNDSCIQMVRLKSLTGNINEAMVWLDKLMKESKDVIFDWNYFETNEDFKNLVCTFDYRQYKEIHKDGK